MVDFIKLILAIVYFILVFLKYPEDNRNPGRET